MFGQGGPVKVFVATRPVDFRKGIDGLALAVQEMFGLDPFCGEVFVFRSKRADRIKLLIWDQIGWCLSTSGWKAASSSGRCAGRDDADIPRPDGGLVRRAGLAAGPTGARATPTGGGVITGRRRNLLFLLARTGFS